MPSLGLPAPLQRFRRRLFGIRRLIPDALSLPKFNSKVNSDLQSLILSAKLWADANGGDTS